MSYTTVCSYNRYETYSNRVEAMHKQVEKTIGSDGPPVPKDYPGDDTKSHQTVPRRCPVDALPNLHQVPWENVYKL
jgi:hypothetical protein